MRKLAAIFLYYGVIPFGACFLGVLPALFGMSEYVMAILIPAIAAILYYVLRRKLNRTFAVRVHLWILMLLILIFTILMIIAEGNIHGTLVSWYGLAILPFGAEYLICSLMGVPELCYLTVLLTYVIPLLVYGQDTIHLIRQGNRKCLAAVLAGLVLMSGINGYLYCNRPEVRYSGHGFDYMHGYSSTDFSDYMVYSEPSKLASLDHEAELCIEDPEKMPVLDGAEACYPLYAALAKSVYKDIAVLEQQEKDENSVYYQKFNGKIVTFTNTVYGLEDLIITGTKEAEYYGGHMTDLFFGAKPSKAQLQMAADYGVELEVTTIGREAFVFFVEEDNPVTNLTSGQIRAIYHGDITNWSEVGGKNQEIVAFQRPAGSGSQSMMEYFMGDISLKEPKTYEYVDSMAGVIRNVAQYANEAGALGYSFRYFLEGLNQEKGVRILSVDGVAPTLENIENGSYPLVTGLSLISRADDPNPNVQKVIDFMLSEDGQELVRQSGYAALS